MEIEVQRLKKRSFEAWETEFTPGLMSSNKLVRVGCATFTMKNRRHLKPHIFKSIMDDYFYKLAKKHGRHFIYLFGSSPEDAPERHHQHGDIFILSNEGELKDPEVFRFCLEASFKHGRCEIEEKRLDGNWSGYSVAKHDGNDDFLKIYCPKTGECGKKRKNDRRFCVYQRSPIKLK